MSAGAEDQLPNQQITLERLNEVLSYDPETGVVSWKGAYTPGRKQRVGCSKEDGRQRVCIDGVRYQLARLCWFLSYGRWPTHCIDHINGNPADNRLSNLRDVKQVINVQNRRGPSRISKTRVLGVIYARTSFNVAMSFMGKPLTVRHIASKEEAAHIYEELKRRIHDGFVEVQS